MILIVGGDSQIGRALGDVLQAEGADVLRTSRRADSHDPRTIPLDLEACADWVPPRGVRAAVLAAGVTRIDACRKNPLQTRLINVVGIHTVAKKLLDGGAFLIYLSSTAVFGGDKPFPGPQDPATPATEYGRQKAAAEAFFHAHPQDTAILRLAKVLAPPVSLFVQWHDALRRGQVIKPFYDMRMSPIPLRHALRSTCAILYQKRGGVFQLSADKDITFVQAGLWAAAGLGVDMNLVQPTSFRSCGIPAEEVPRHTTVDSRRALLELGIDTPRVEDVVCNALAQSGPDQSGVAA